MELTKKQILDLLENESGKSFGCSLAEASKLQAYKALCTVIRDLLSKQRKSFRDDFIAKEKKQVYYMSMEFLVGTSLRNNLFNLGLEDKFASVLKSVGFSLSEHVHSSGTSVRSQLVFCSTSVFLMYLWREIYSMSTYSSAILLSSKARSYFFFLTQDLKQ